MFSDIECPNPAYDCLLDSGILKRILDRKEDIDLIFLYDSLYEGMGKEVMKKAEKGINNVTEEGRIFREILCFANQLEEERPSMDEFDEAMVNNPSFVAYLVLGRELFNPIKFGFSSIRSLEEAIASFCIGESHLFKRLQNSWIWRNKDFKNGIYLNEHGDFYASQKDVSGREQIKKTLFGDVKEFDCVKRVERSSTIYSYQGWSGFLVSLLKYAESIGERSLPEIVEWRRVLSEVGAIGTNTAECLLGGGSDWHVDFLLEQPILTQGIKLETYPLTLPCRELTIIPYISQGRLIYMTKTKGNEGHPLKEFEGTCLENDKFNPEVIYNERDLPDALRATYKFFARDKSILPKIMESFLV